MFFYFNRGEFDEWHLSSAKFAEYQKRNQKKHTYKQTHSQANNNLTQI